MHSFDFLHAQGKLQMCRIKQRAPDSSWKSNLQTMNNPSYFPSCEGGGQRSALRVLKRQIPGPLHEPPLKSLKKKMPQNNQKPLRGAAPHAALRSVSSFFSCLSNCAPTRPSRAAHVRSHRASTTQTGVHAERAPYAQPTPQKNPAAGKST